MPKLFQKKIEDFVCGKCGEMVTGNGFTNHCPKCLWSKHVDINPGDREAVCGGMMKPIGVEFEKGEYFLIHECEKCGFSRRKAVEKSDNFDEVVKISKKVAEK
ncbi:MAG: RNHCP domain-containing protein [bacterium]